MTAAERPMVTIALNEDARFSYPQDDGYWSVLNPALGGYEFEVEWLLRGAVDMPYEMLDCGANMGYWSIVASSAPFGRHSVTAVEPADGNFGILAMNARDNGDRFRAVKYALDEVSGRQVSLYGRRHYGLSLRDDWHPADRDHVEQVETISLDDLAERCFAGRSHPLLVKLDVEGAEIAAMRGGSRVIKEGALIIYEDHGKEPTHPVSRFVLAIDDVEVWRLGDNRRPSRIGAVEDVAKIKTDPVTGYNFFAYKQPSPWASLFSGSGR
jgi:FkbM family methyltransferase